MDENKDLEKPAYPEKKSNFQYPKRDKTKEVFIVVLVGQNFLILKDGEGNNIRVKYFSNKNIPVGEKIYREDGKFSWEMG